MAGYDTGMNIHAIARLWLDTFIKKSTAETAI
jgi:hypothetical protein